jgi:glucosyl-dolichyl phosphate glucuronosyltransferase
MTAVSVIIATRNRQRLLAQTLDALAAQRWPASCTEIIVADNGSTDATRAVVDAAAARPFAATIRYLHVATPGKSHAVNAALELAHGDLIAFTDDDVQPEPPWLESLVAAVERSGADFVAGRMRPIWEVEPPRWLSSALHGVLAIADNGDRRLPLMRGLNDHIVPIGANMAVRRHVLQRLGGLHTGLGKLDGSLRTGEDHELYLRMLHAGCRGAYEPTAIVGHWVPRERLVRGYFRRWLYQNGRDVARLETAYAAHARHLLGVPRWLWRQSAVDVRTAVAATIARDPAERVAASLRVLWFAGYVRQTWFGWAAPVWPLHTAEQR